MMPSTGPKHSVRWNHEPGCTSTRTPGDQRTPSSSSCAGSTSHRSPGSSVVRARSRFPLGGEMSGPAFVAGSRGEPTFRLRTASASRRWKEGSSYTDASTTARLAAEHFWPEWPNAERTRSLIAWSRSAAAVMTRVFLPLVSACSRSAGFQPRNSDAVSWLPVSMTRSTSSCVMSRRPTSSSGVQASCTTPSGTPARRSWSTRCAATARVSGAGFITTLQPGGDRVHEAARRDRVGEVPRTGHDDDARRVPSRAGLALLARRDPLVPTRQVPRVPGEVDRLGHLRVALGDRLARGARHQGDGVAALRLHEVRAPARARRDARPTWSTPTRAAPRSRSRRGRPRPPAS